MKAETDLEHLGLDDGHCGDDEPDEANGSPLARAKAKRIDDILEDLSLAADNGYVEPVRHNGRRVYTYCVDHTLPTKREAKQTARKLRKMGYGARYLTRSSDSKGRFYMAKWRRKMRYAQAEMRDYYVEVSGYAPF